LLPHVGWGNYQAKLQLSIFLNVLDIQAEYHRDPGIWTGGYVRKKFRHPPLQLIFAGNNHVFADQLFPRMTKY